MVPGSTRDSMLARGRSWKGLPDYFVFCVYVSDSTEIEKKNEYLNIDNQHKLFLILIILLLLGNG